MTSKLNLSWSLVWLTIYYIGEGYATEKNLTCLLSNFTAMEQLSEEFKKPVQLQEEIINVSFQSHSPTTQEASGTYQLITYYEKMQLPEKYVEYESRFIIQKHPFYGDWRLSKIFKRADQKPVVIDSSTNKNNIYRNPFIFYGFFALQKSAKEMKFSNDTLKKELAEQQETNQSLLERISILQETEVQSMSIIQKLKLQLSVKNSEISMLQHDFKANEQKIKSEIAKNIQLEDTSTKNKTYLHKIKQLEEKLSETKSKFKNLYFTFETKFKDKILLQNEKHANEILLLNNQNFELKTNHEQEMEKVKETFSEKIEKLNEADNLQLQLKKSESENAKLKNIQAILDDEIRTLKEFISESNKQWKKKLKECEEKFTQEEKKYKSLTTNQKFENKNKKLESDKNLLDAQKELQKILNAKQVVNAKICNKYSIEKQYAHYDLKKLEKTLIPHLENENDLFIPDLLKRLKECQDTFIMEEAKLILKNLNEILLHVDSF
jgi:hypothetical protein